jgi:hypothetical protein
MSQNKTGAGTPGRNPRMEAAIGIGSEIADQVQETLSGSRIRSVRIKLGKHTIREIPVKTAALSAILIAAAAAIISNLRIEIDKE